MGRVRRKKTTDVVVEDPPQDVAEPDEDVDVSDDIGENEDVLAESSFSEPADLDEDASLDDDVVDLDEVLKSSTGENLALRREIERRLEERRLAKDLDELDFDLD